LERPEIFWNAALYAKIWSILLIKAGEKMINFGVLTISDKGSLGQRVDGSGPAIKDRIALLGGRVVRYEIVPDEIDRIQGKFVEWADSGEVDVILSTGGTGLGPRDVTPEATIPILDKLVPGIAEAMRLVTFAKTPASILSRAVAGVRKKCLIVNLPGSPKAVRECLEPVIPAIVHAVEMISGAVTEHNVQEAGKNPKS
jgi:molybdopterin adenylyltransferase